MNVQLSLLPESESPLRSKLREGTGRLAKEGVFLGTSSWKYEGWIDLLYTRSRYTWKGRFSQKRFNDDCLAEYAETFPSVSVDASFYQFPSEKQLTSWADKVPTSFQFGFKVTEEITTPRFSALPRYGEKAGSPNNNFLNAELFAERFLGPCEQIRDQVGIIMFQFPQMPVRDHEAFLNQLDAFFDELPKGWKLATEIRDEELLDDDYFNLLERRGVGHIFNSWTHMPPVAEQLKRVGDRLADLHTGSRLLLKPGRTYANAVKKFSPYKVLRDIQEPTREAAACLIKRMKDGRTVHLYGNNRLEGCSPETLSAIIDRL